MIFILLITSSCRFTNLFKNHPDNPGATPQSLPQPEIKSLRVSGNKIVDANGNEIYLRGFQGLGAYPISDDLFIKAVFDNGLAPDTLDPIAQDIQRYTLADFDVNEIKSTGANVVRLWVMVHSIQRIPGEYSETALQMLEDAVTKFGEGGIYTIFVMSGAGENNYDFNQVYLDRGINLWDPNSDARENSIAVWGVLSERFSDNPYVAGYDVMNEPMPPTAQALHDYYVDLIHEIRKHDKNHIIFLPVAEGNQDTFQIGGEYEDDNIAVTFHFYYPHDFTLEPDIPNQTYPGTYHGKYWDKAALEKVFATAINLPQLKDKPIFVGEFGAGGERDGNGGLEWTRDVLEIMNRYGLHYTYHIYKHQVHKGYWIKKPEAFDARGELIDAIIEGRMNYEDLTEEQKRNQFMTEYNFYRREGIKEILTEAFTYGR
jgi:hypothetical protein